MERKNMENLTDEELKQLEHDLSRDVVNLNNKQMSLKILLNSLN